RSKRDWSSDVCSSDLHRVCDIDSLSAGGISHGGGTVNRAWGQWGIQSDRGIDARIWSKGHNHKALGSPKVSYIGNKAMMKCHQALISEYMANTWDNTRENTQ